MVKMFLGILKASPFLQKFLLVGVLALVASAAVPAFLAALNGWGWAAIAVTAGVAAWRRWGHHLQAADEAAEEPSKRRL